MRRRPPFPRPPGWPPRIDIDAIREWAAFELAMIAMAIQLCAAMREIVPAPEPEMPHG